MPAEHRGTVAHLVMYGRTGCHLCEDMLDALEACRGDLCFTLEYRDIDARPAWRERYAALIPVLLVGEQEICHHFLDKIALLDHFSGTA